MADETRKFTGRTHYDAIAQDTVAMIVNDLIVVGCNGVNTILIPDYHFWGSSRRWKRFGKKTNEKSVLIFPRGIDKNLVRRYWEKGYELYDTKERLPGSNTRTHKTIYDYFGNVGMVSTLWAYQQGAASINIVGMDGYSLYPPEQLESKKNSQHCYGRGFTDAYTYEYCMLKDIKNYRLLKKLYKYSKERYGFGFKIITPTIFVKFYDKSILDIEEEYNGEDIFLRNARKIKRKIKQKQRKNFHY